MTGVLGKIVNNLVGADDGKNVVVGNPSEAKDPVVGEAAPSAADSDAAGAPAAATTESTFVAEAVRGSIAADLDSGESYGRIGGNANGGINATKGAEEVCGIQ